MREKTLELKLREKIAAMGGGALKINCLSFTGLPDRLILLPIGRVYFAEMKTKGKKPNARQKVVHKWLKKMGFWVFVIHDQQTFDDCIKYIENA